MNFDSVANMPSQFIAIAIIPILGGCALILLSRPIRRFLADT
jgi:hypothetical protein